MRVRRWSSLTGRQKWAAAGGLLTVPLLGGAAVALAQGKDPVATVLVLLAVLLLVPFRVMVDSVGRAEARHPRSGPRRPDTP